jgi:hypothetical protein
VKYSARNQSPLQQGRGGPRFRAAAAAAGWARTVCGGGLASCVAAGWAISGGGLRLCVAAGWGCQAVCDGKLGLYMAADWGCIWRRVGAVSGGGGGLYGLRSGALCCGRRLGLCVAAGWAVGGGRLGLRVGL